MKQLSDILEPNNLRLLFALTSFAGDVADAARKDLSFARCVIRTMGPWPMSGQRDGAPVFPPMRPLPGLAGKRIAVVSSGGSGATASLCGVRRAFEDAGIEPVAISACSGSTLFASLWAAGLDAEEMARFWLSLHTRDYVDPDYLALGRAALTRFKRFGGILRGAAIEASYRRRLSGMKLGETKIPLSTVVWNIDLNRVEYLGTRSTPEIDVARASRIAISIPIMVEPVKLGAHYYGDGGIVDIFPTRPLLEELPLDHVIGTNLYVPRDFSGENVEGWYEKPWAILRASGQLRYAVYLELARERARALGAKLTLLHPVSYDEVRGAKFYQSFLDRRDWPRFMLQGYQVTRAALERLATSDARSSRVSISA